MMVSNSSNFILALSKVVDRWRTKSRAIKVSILGELNKAWALFWAKVSNWFWMDSSSSSFNVYGLSAVSMKELIING